VVQPCLVYIGWKYSPNLYENIKWINCILLPLKGKEEKIPKFSFKSRGYSKNPNNTNEMKDLETKSMLGHYLAGLIEGDGSIIVPKTIRNNKGKLLYPFTSPLLKTGKLKRGGNNTHVRSVKESALHPFYVSGFVDGEGAFSVSILKRAVYKTGWSISPVFTVSLHSRDAVLLKKIQSFFGVGKITIRSKDGSVYFTVNSIKDLMEVIIPHFDKYPLSTEKQADYELFKQIVSIMYNKQHLNIEGLHKVLSFKASMNNGLTPVLIEHFPNINPSERPAIKTQERLDPHWVAGFVEAEGCFSISTIKSELYKTGYQIKLHFSVVQHSRDILLMKRIVEYFNCGAVYENTGHVTFIVTKLSDIRDKIIPFFKEYSLQGFKLSDYEKFCKVAILMQEKAHLSIEGINKILGIKRG
jgi:hypothetical protein